MALTILTAGLAACGLLLLLWSVAEAMLLPLPREDAVLVAPLQGGAAEVERADPRLPLDARASRPARTNYLDRPRA